jgi:hypothetical protein
MNRGGGIRQAKDYSQPRNQCRVENISDMWCLCQRTVNVSDGLRVSCVLAEGLTAMVTLVLVPGVKSVIEAEDVERGDAEPRVVSMARSGKIVRDMMVVEMEVGCIIALTRDG